MSKEKISPEEYQDAKKTMEAFHQQSFEEKNGLERPCICCDKSITPIDAEVIRLPRVGMYKHGTANVFSCGFGSDHDMDKFLIAICDDCITRLHDQQKIEFLGNEWF